MDDPKVEPCMFCGKVKERMQYSAKADGWLCIECLDRGIRWRNPTAQLFEKGANDV